MNKFLFCIFLLFYLTYSCKQKSGTNFLIKNGSILSNNDDTLCYIKEFLDSVSNCKKVVYYFKKVPVLIQVFNNRDKLITEYSGIYIDTILKIDKTFDTITPVYYCIQFNKSEYYSNGILKSKFITSKNQIEYVLKYDSITNKITMDTIDMKKKMEYSNELRNFFKSNK